MVKLKSLPGLRLFDAFSALNRSHDNIRFCHIARLAFGLLVAGAICSPASAGAQAVNFGNVNVCSSGATKPKPCDETLPVSFKIAEAGTLATPRVFTQGAPDLDFTLAKGSTCVGSVTKGATCTVNVTFAPLAPGLRRGGVQIADGSGNVVATTYIYGTGTGPAIAYAPTARLTLGSGFRQAIGIAVDANGNVYVADDLDDDVKEILAVNGSIPANPTIRTLASDISAPYGVAVDGLGNVFFTSLGGAGQVNEILAVNGSIPAIPTVQIVGIGFPLATGLAVDGSGNLFVGVELTDSAAVLELPANSPIPFNPGFNNNLGYGFVSIYSVAVDGEDNVFVADNGAFEVDEISAADNYTTVSVLLKGNSLHPAFVPLGVAVDASGNVYVTGASGTKGGIALEMLAVNGSIPADPTVVTILGSGSNIGFGAAVDGSGNLFLGDGRQGVIELQRSQPPTLKFAATDIGATSTDSPQSITFQNIGNATLTGSGALSDTTDFTVVPGLGIAPDCTPETLSLDPGAACDLSIDFTPQSAGKLKSHLTLTDNTLNATTVPEDKAKVKLSGKGLTPPPNAEVSTSLLEFGKIPYPNGLTLPLTISNVGGGTLTVATAINGPSYKIASSTCAAGVTAGESCILEVKYSPVAIGPHDDHLTLTTNGSSNPTVELKGYSTGVGALETESPLQFGTIAHGATEVLPLTLYNDGVSGAVMIGSSINGPSYKVITKGNTCRAGVTSGQTCILPVEFDPVATGAHDDILTITPTGGAAATTVKLKGVAD